MQETESHNKVSRFWYCRTKKVVEKLVVQTFENQFLKFLWHRFGATQCWVYSSGGNKELWAWTFIHPWWTLQYLSEGISFSRLLEGLIGGPVFKNVGERWMTKN